MADLVLLIADLISLPLANIGDQWGIFQNGIPIVQADSVKGFRFRRDWELLTYSVEQGAFETYNKVAKPFQPTIRMATGGSVADKEAFLASIDAIAGDLNLYDVVTPEVTYSSVNVEGFDYDRTALKGVGLLHVDILLKEVRVTGTIEFTDTTTPSGSNAVSSGTVQTSAASGIQLSQVADGLQ